MKCELNNASDSSTLKSQFFRKETEMLKDPAGLSTFPNANSSVTVSSPGNKGICSPSHLLADRAKSSPLCTRQPIFNALL
jgi:hypothetical protein